MGVADGDAYAGYEGRGSGGEARSTEPSGGLCTDTYCAGGDAARGMGAGGGGGMRGVGGVYERSCTVSALVKGF